MAFKPQLTLPEKGNPFYNTKSNGGYSTAIVGKPTCAGLNVLSNCSGQTFGRFNEIADDKKMTLLAPVNAEDMWDYAGKCKKGQTPKLGAVMCWAKGKAGQSSDGCGHVCIVEKIISETEVVTSESGYNNPTPWYSKTRKKGNGNWGQPKEYSFRGFIYNPAVPDEPDYEARIKEFQKWLNKNYGLNLAVDGHCGKSTKSGAIEAMQIELNKLGECLLIDGRCGAKTSEAMYRHKLKKGDKGNRVYICQGLLYGMRIDCNGFDGSFGAGMEKAVKTAQTAKKIKVDGIIGGETFSAISS